jgi:putative inorganic carbon (HCO3(-)) transporter
MLASWRLRWLNPLTLLFGLMAAGVGAAAVVVVAVLGSVAKVAVVVVGLVGAFATVAQAEVGLLALTFMTYTRFSDVLVRYHGAPSTAKLFVALLLGAIAMRWLIYKQQPRGWELSGALVVLYGLVGFATLLYAADAYRAQEAVSDYFKDAIIAVIVVILLQTPTTMRRVVWTLLATGIFMGTISVYQYLAGAYDNSFWGFGQAAVQNIVGESDDYRVSGPLGDPNFFAQIMLVLVPLALDRLWSEHQPGMRLLAGWAVAATLITILVTFSRGAFLGLVAVLGLLAVRRPPSPLGMLLTLAVLVPLLQLTPASYTARLQTLTEAIPFMGGNVKNEVSFRGRTSELMVGWMMFLDHPILGVGWNNYPVYYQQYSRGLGIDDRRTERNAHSFYLQVAAESGVVGLTTLGLMLWVLLHSLRTAERDFVLAGLLNSAGMAAAFQIGMIGYLLAAVFLHAAYPRYLWLLFGIGLAMRQVAKNELAAVQKEAGA